ncbi:MAG: phosphonopyruvate decarboxylase [Alphaproteobacteria bacterium]|nr:phosphonopyruvate decarboxylase [Alphaproteobacteria bacterium]
MIRADQFIDEAAGRGFDFYTGVPCSFLTPLINGVISDDRLAYVGAASEGEAVAIAAGAWLAGKKPIVMFQNSGLGNAVNPLTSLNAPFHIPSLLIATWRGEPGRPDEPQHEVMGQITHDLLSLMGIAHAPLPNRADTLPAAFEKADAVIARDACYAFVMADGSMETTGLKAGPARAHRSVEAVRALKGGVLPTRAEILERFLALTGEDRAVIATTGKSGRELFMLKDRPQQLYLVGSMGGAAGVGLGVALNTGRPVAVLDGDGAALMKLGTLATIGAQAPTNLIHILLDNGVHDSTGGQPTVSAAIDFAAIAAACSYRNAATCDSVEDFAELFESLSGKDGPSLLHVRIAPGSLPKLIRPTVKPRDVARRFRAFLAGAAP